MHYKRTILILIDGARPDVLAEEMQRGRLPCLSQLAEQGTSQTITTVFPSTTGPAYLPFLTGKFPGPCNIPGIRWFDRELYARKGWNFGCFRSYVGPQTRLLNADMSPNVKTAWEYFSEPRNILNGVTKGLAKKHNRTRFSRASDYVLGHFTGCWHLVDQAVSHRLLKIVKNDDFDFIFCVFPGVDEFAHRGSPFNERVRKTYAEVDRSLAAVVDALKQRGLLDETLFLIVSDHGSSEVHGHFDVGPWMQKHLKLKTLYHTNIFKTNFDAVSMVSGNGMAHLYFKSEKGWGSRVSSEEFVSRRWVIDALLERPEVDLLVLQGEDGRIHVLSSRGAGRFSVNAVSQKISYQFQKDDPLGIFVQGDQRLGPDLDFATSLSRTFDSEYPDLFVQLHQIFQSPRAGDLIVSAKRGFDLRKRYEFPEHHAGHGALHREHMHVPLISNHRISKRFMRTVDLYDLIIPAR